MLIKKIKSFFIFKKSFDVGQKFFLLGTFFLPSALPIAGILLLISIIIAFIYDKEKIFNDRWNYPIFTSILFIFIFTLYSSLQTEYEAIGIEKSIIWMNLLNWIPILLCYIGFQTYLINDNQRLLFRNFLISGTFPVIVSCIIQKFFNLYGPFETLFGTIVWFNRPLYDANLTGLFNNRNYLGIWITLCLPFTISALKNENSNLFNRIIICSFTLSYIYIALLTSSRNALLGIVLSFIFMFELKKVIIFFFYFLTGIFIISYLIPTLLNLNEINILQTLPFDSFQKMSNLDIRFNYERIFIWRSAISFISNKPLLGWGPGTFSYIFKEQGYVAIPFYIGNYQHTHNLFLEIAYNFGIPIALTLSFTFISIYIKSFKNLYASNKSSLNFYNKSWLASVSIFLTAHVSDVTYYDGKISILFAILLSGLKNILIESENANFSLKTKLN